MKFQCVCGNVIYDQTFPNPIGYRLIDDRAFDEITSAPTIDAKQLWRRSTRVLQCDVCRRLYVLWEGKLPAEEFIPVKSDGTIPGYVLIEPTKKSNSNENRE